jgi:hypothetical protein
VEVRLRGGHRESKTKLCARLESGRWRWTGGMRGVCVRRERCWRCVVRDSGSGGEFETEVVVVVDDGAVSCSEMRRSEKSKKGITYHACTFILAVANVSIR